MRSPTRQPSLLAVGLLLLIAAPQRATASGSGPLPHLWSFPVGDPPREVSLRVEAAPGGTRVVVHGGAGGGEGLVAVDGVVESELEHVALPAGAAAVIVRLRGTGGEGAALVLVRAGRGRVLWTGRTDLHGDPGEREADVIEVLDLDGDGAREPVVGRRSERATVCGGVSILAPRALDPRSWTLRAARVRRVPAGAAVPTGALVPDPTVGPRGRPLLQGLRFVGASSRADGPAGSVTAPGELADGDPRTAWVEGVPGGGSGEFLSARWDVSPRPLRALALWAPPPTMAAPPRTLWIASDGGASLRVALPDTWPSDRPLWVELPQPLTGRCLAFVIEEPRDDSAGARTGLGEVAAYSDLDFAGGLEALVAELSLEPQRSREAARWLVTVGPAAVAPIVAAWPEMPTRERRLALPVLARHASRSAEARRLLAEAARPAGDEGMRRAALEGLEGAGPDGWDLLAGLVPDPELGDAAAAALLRADPARALDAALLALEGAEGARHPTLRRTIGLAAARLGDEAAPRIRRFADGEAAVVQRAEVALALAQTTSAPRALAESLLDEELLASDDFEARWYAVGAWGGLPASDRGIAWLDARAREPAPWMMRAAALDALGRVAPEGGAEAARDALAAPEPRVRVAAVELLGARASTAETVAALALRDPWARVRIAALEAIAPVPEAAPVLRAAVRDRKGAVRAAAIRTLTRVRDPEAWAVVEERLRTERESPAVTRAGIAYARSLCLSAALPELGATVDRGLAPEARAPDVDTAMEAIAAVASIGGADAEAILQRAEAPTAPPALREAAQRARRHASACTP